MANEPNPILFTCERMRTFGLEYPPLGVRILIGAIHDNLTKRGNATRWIGEAIVLRVLRPVFTHFPTKSANQRSVGPPSLSSYEYRTIRQHLPMLPSFRTPYVILYYSSLINGVLASHASYLRAIPQQDNDCAHC